MCGINCLFGIEVKCIQNIINSVCTKRDTDTTQARHAEDTCKIIVTTTTCDTSHWCIKCFHLKDSSRIVVESTGQCQIELYFVVQSCNLQSIKDELRFFNTFLSYIRTFKHFSNGIEFILIRSFQRNDRLKLLYSLVTDTISLQLCIDIIETYFVEFINSDCYINDLVSFSDNLSNARKYLSVINLYLNSYTEFRKDSVNNLHQFNLVQQGIRTNNICITLVEFTITSFLWTVCTPHRLYLIAFEGQLKFFTVHHNIARKRNCQIITKSFFT